MSPPKSHSKNWPALPDPYPEPRVVQKNAYYARLLAADLAGGISELTAITQYMSHYILAKGEYADIAHLLERVAVTEMRHFEMLAATIRLLGACPVIGAARDNAVEYWSGKYVYYGDDIVDRLTADIAHEADAIKNSWLTSK